MATTVNLGITKVEITDEVTGRDSTEVLLKNLKTDINAALDVIDDAAAGALSIALTGTSTTLTAGQYRNRVLIFTGTPGGAATVNVPATEHSFSIYNNTNQTVTVKVAAQTGVVVSVGEKTFAYNNGTDVVSALTAGTTYTQTYATADRTHANATTAAMTDSTTGTAGTTFTAGVGRETWFFPIDLASITAAGDVLTSRTVGYRFKILAVDFFVTKPVTTAAKAAVLNIEIGTTDLTGGAVSLTSANCTPLGVQVAGSAVTAANVGTSSDLISIEAASVTAFAEGQGVLVVRAQNMDTADAVASAVDQLTKAAADLLDAKQLLNAIIDDLQLMDMVL